MSSGRNPCDQTRSGVEIYSSIRLWLILQFLDRKGTRGKQKLAPVQVSIYHLGLWVTAKLRDPYVAISDQIQGTAMKNSKLAKRLGLILCPHNQLQRASSIGTQFLVPSTLLFSICRLALGLLGASLEDLSRSIRVCLALKTKSTG